MTPTTYTDPAFDALAARASAALKAQATTIDPAVDWPTVKARIDANRDRSFLQRIGRRPMLAGAAALLLVFAVLAVVALRGGDDSAEDLDIVNTPEPTESFSLVAVDASGGLVELGADGVARSGVVADVERGASDVAIAPWDPDEVWWISPVPTEPSCEVIDAPLTTLNTGRIGGDGEDGPPPSWYDGVLEYGISPDGQSIASAARVDPCGQALLNISIRDVVTGNVESEFDAGDFAGVRDLAWLEEDLLAVLIGEGRDPSMTAAGTVVVVRPSDGVADLNDAGGEVQDRARMIMPVAAQMESTPDGDLLIAGPLDDEPFDFVIPMDDATTEPPYRPITVWRGNPLDYTATKMGEVDASLFGTPAELLPDGRQPLTVLSLSDAPDGSVYLTMAETEHVAADGFTVDDPSSVALVRMHPDGRVERLRDGVLSVAVREGGSQPSSSTTTAPANDTTELSGSATTVPVRAPLPKIPPEWDQTRAPMSQGWTECTDLGADPDHAEQPDEVAAIIERIAEEADRIGWTPTKRESLTSNQAVCGWSRNGSTGVLLDWSDESDFPNQVAGRTAIYDVPQGEVIGYAWYPEAYVSVEELADPDFDLEAAMIEKFGHCVTLRGNDTCPENPLAD